VRVRDNLNPGSARVSRVTPVRLGLSAFRRNGFLLRFAYFGQQARIRKVGDREDAIANTRTRALSGPGSDCAAGLLTRPRFAAKWHARIRD
jgi:hypothetical protein